MLIDERSSIQTIEKFASTKMTSNNEDYIKKNKVITVDEDKNTRLHYAAASENLPIIEEEIATGKKLDPENYMGWTPLMMAVRNGNLDAVNLLLKNKADATKKNRYGINVFLMSVTSGSLELLTVILNHLLCGGISRQSLQKVLSPISLAIMFGHSHIFKYLLERNFDVNASTPLTGISPLMFAAAMGNSKAMKKLVQHHANPKQKNYLGQTAQNITQTRNNKTAVDGVAKPKPPAPHIFLTSENSNNSPCFQLTPFPNVNSQNQAAAPKLRKSSNTLTPNMMCFPNITPIIPNGMPQMFFPPEFTPSQYHHSPMYQNYSNEFLNANIAQSPYFSPMPPQMCYTNYV